MPSSPLLFPSLPCSALALTFSSVSPTPPATNKFDYVALRARRFPSPPSPCMPRPPSPVVAGYLSMPKGRAEPSGAAGAGAMDTGTYSLFPFLPRSGTPARALPRCAHPSTEEGPPRNRSCRQHMYDTSLVTINCVAMYVYGPSSFHP